MIKLLIAFTAFVSSIYSLHFTDVGGDTIQMNSFRGKKILLVNIATGSNRVSQLTGLQQLQQQYTDSLVVIAFPSNSFGNERRNNAGILQFCQTYGVAFPIAEKNSVKGEGLQSIYQWLADSSQNGVMNSIPTGDFYKVLIDSKGEILGVFAPALPPMDMVIQDAITGANQN